MASTNLPTQPHKPDSPNHPHSDCDHHENPSHSDIGTGSSHHHGSGHVHAPKDFGKAFAFGAALNIGFVIAEVIGGLSANSLALLADAGHNLSDVLALLMAWGASVLARRLPSARYTYGLRSTSILVALINAVLILIVTGGIAWEAIGRFRHPSEIQSGTVIVVAAIGVVINTVTALMFMRGRQGDLNIRSAFLHMASDALISLGVVLSGTVIIYTGWEWLDPAVSLVIALLIVIGTWGLLNDSVRLALQGVPQGLSIDRVRDYLNSLPGVTSIHDLHIWGMSTTETALTVHLVVPKGYPGDQFVSTISEQLQNMFAICHATIQIETGSAVVACKLEPDHLV
jgi:cobalt-zinc-cadmium efflux system protein